MYTFSEKLRRVQKLNQNFLQICASTHHVLTLQSVTKFYGLALTNRFSRIYNLLKLPSSKGQRISGQRICTSTHDVIYIYKVLRNSFEQQFKQDWWLTDGGVWKQYTSWNSLRVILAIRMHCKIVFNFALRHDLALLQNNRWLA